MLLCGFDRNYTVGMEFLNSLIAFIRYHLSLWRKVYVTFPKDIEVMAFTFGHKNTYNIPS